VAGGYCVRVERERKLRLKRTRRKGGKGGCSGLRSPWRSSRRWRARTATWSASDMGDGAVGTGVREARRGDGAARAAERRCQNGAAGRHLYGIARGRTRCGAGAWQPRGDGVLTGGPGAGNGG
jgi:hypothetical protein